MEATQTETAKAIKKASVSQSDDNLTLVWTFGNGVRYTIHIPDFSETHAQALAHGYKQKLSDSYSGAKTPDEAEALFTKVLDKVRSGDWSGRDTEGGPRETPLDLLAEAFILGRQKIGQGQTKDGQPLTVELVKPKLAQMDQKARAQLRRTLAVEVEEIRRAKAERPADLAAIEI